MTVKKVAVAICAHPDDIEFGMAGTLYLLKENGYEIHYMTIANGNCGSFEIDSETIINIRTKESKEAAKILGAHYHASLCDDFNIFNTSTMQRYLCDIIRSIGPDIILTHSPEDYMRDHEETAALVRDAAFYRSMQNAFSVPTLSPIFKDVRIYHAQPHGNRDRLGKFVEPEIIVDIDSVMGIKEKALKAHVSQEKFLEKQQGINSYVKTMREFNAEIADKIDGIAFIVAGEGWRKHNHLGYCPKDFDPLFDALKEYIHKNKNY